MSEAEHLADALSGLFTRTDNGWFTPFTEVIAGLTGEQAARVPAPRFNSVWGLVNHVWFWHEIVLLRLRGLSTDRPELWADNGWPPPADPPSEEAWQEACAKALAVNAELAQLVAGLTDEELAQASAPGRAARWQVVQGLIAHNSYHICEIISVRHMQGFWLERT